MELKKKKSIRNSSFKPNGDFYCEKVIDFVFNLTGITKEQIIGPKRSAEVVIPRQMCHWAMYHVFGFGVVIIGRLMNRDHSSISNSIISIDNILYCKTKPYYEYILKLKQLENET